MDFLTHWMITAPPSRLWRWFWTGIRSSGRDAGV